MIIIKPYEQRKNTSLEKVLKTFFKTSEEVVAEVAKESDVAKEIYDSFYNFRKKSIDMANVSELGFMKYRGELWDIFY